MFDDIRRLISFMDVLYHIGNMLYKRSLRYTAVTAAMSLLGLLGNLVPGVETYSIKVALALPLIVGSAALVGGLLLKAIPSIIAARMVNVAQAQDIDLMEDYRKAREEVHLDALWRRVFRFEWRLGTEVTEVHEHAEEAPAEVCRPVEAGDPEECGRQEFMARSRFALARPQPQSRQRYYLGIDLHFLEDWRNGGYFDRNDVKLMEQYEAGAILGAVRRDLDYGPTDSLRDLPLRWMQRFWTMMISRAVAIHVGEAVTALNRQYATDCFNAQVLLWPGEDREPWLDQFPGAAEEVRRLRRKLVERIFAADDREAREMLDRMVLPGFLLATRLRIRYDPEYLDGSLGYDAADDLETVGLPARRIERFRLLARHVVEERGWLLACLKRHRPELVEPDREEWLRAVRIAIHCRRRTLRGLLAKEAQGAAADGAFAVRVLPVIDGAVERRPAITCRLVGLRVHHELTRLHHAEYHDLLQALRHSGEEPHGLQGPHAKVRPSVGQATSLPSHRSGAS